MTGGNWVHKMPHTGQAKAKVMTLFQKQFNKAPPQEMILLDWEKHTLTLGTVKDWP